MKAEPKIYKGIEYIDLVQLPKEQYKFIKEWVESDSLITLKIDDKLITNCLQYSDYSHWYDNVYLNSSQPKKTRKVISRKSLFGFAIDTNRD